MADVQIKNDNLVITIQGIRKVLTLKQELSFPLSAVKGVTYDPNVNADYPSGWEKRKGTNVFNTYYGGTFRQDGETIFWDVRKPENTIVITVDDEEYQRLMVEVDEPKDTLRLIETAMQNRNR